VEGQADSALEILKKNWDWVWGTQGKKEMKNLFFGLGSGQVRKRFAGSNGKEVVRIVLGSERGEKGRKSKEGNAF